MSSFVKNRGWRVAISGTGINLALGILYTWSIFKAAIKQSIESGGDNAFNWNISSLNDPYAVCCLVFSFAMILAGKCQDRLGPRVTAFIGGILVGMGFIWISQTTRYISWILGFGILAGTGIGFGYSSATPPALKWFPPAKTGLIAGIVVSGFGLASVYIAPLSEYLLRAFGLQNAMLFFGVAFLIIVCSLATLLVNPPEGYISSQTNLPKIHKDTDSSAQEELRPSEIIKTRVFYILWLIYFIGAGAGLMVIGSVAGMAKKSMGDMAFIVVALLAVGNAGGRIIAGILSDKIGRGSTLIIMLLFQALLMFICIPFVGGETGGAAILLLLATFIGFNYGSNLSLFPSYTKDLWGLKNFGTNYGIVFTSWGVGGFVMGRLSQMLVAKTGSYTTSFMTAGILLVVGAVLTLSIKEKRHHKESVSKEVGLAFGRQG